ncbi:rod shape-determining protein MreD [Nocardioides marmotae]|uniref:Rod shape-determining protein MreD n=1 Tax=Nocardioides marmotae TaxID=2663857 RepID=A0A6I3JGB3_9ACTN|nr:rod shape-determining protein MreD [Nocardioides marmotae]MCR6033444.1 rod shape-determining protein MreD [Gordonia jinghuaiqii]MBC9734687.1 rod shape-determining protein MreD [Nocardioides marmotae]MTB85789.1 rod shape-determining protein MreD [Nocardioides marmotae]MTB97102.1 rod shape-determining protein MreD [Nocardioides marmotae]QKE00759.1 rod shape-determining protein MreD [Nocardioides marmotae]
MNPARAALTVVAVAAALVLQVTVFSHVSWHGVVPNLVLLVVVATGLVRGAQPAMVLGFAAGVLLDLAPPADHVAGRWALALVVVGYVAGRVRQDVRPTVGSVVATVAASSFVGTSVFALTGILLRDPALGVGEVLQVIAIGVGWDVLLTPFVLPVVMGAYRRLEPARATA